MSFLIVAPKIIRCKQFSLRFRRTQVKVYHRLWVVGCRVEMDVGGHPM